MSTLIVILSSLLLGFAFIALYANEGQPAQRSAAPLPSLTIRDPSMAMAALCCTPPLPSISVPARMVTGCWAVASTVDANRVKAAMVQG